MAGVDTIACGTRVACEGCFVNQLTDLDERFHCHNAVQFMFDELGEIEVSRLHQIGAVEAEAVDSLRTVMDDVYHTPAMLEAVISSSRMIVDDICKVELI